MAGSPHGEERWPQWLPREQYPFGNRYAEIDGCTVHYLDEGEGPTLLLLHGNPTWSFLYRKLIPPLAGSFRCVAVDYPGFGLSRAAPDYGFTFTEHAAVAEQLLLRLDLREVTMVVHDWGGPVGFSVATRHPGRFAGFVIANSWAWPLDDPLVRLFSLLLGGPLGDHLIVRRNLFAGLILPLNVMQSRLPPPVRNAYRAPFPTPQSRLPQQVLVRELRSAVPALAELEKRLAVLADRPALIAWAGRDPAFRRTQRRRWQAHFPNHALVELPRAGHYLYEDAADEIALAILHWHRERHAKNAAPESGGYV